MLRKKLNAKITIFRKDDTVDISSTELREALTDPSSKKASEYLPEPVLKIIRKRGLYKDTEAQD